MAESTQTWEPAARVQKNDAGEYRAFIGDAWVPVARAQKNESGEFRVMRNAGLAPVESGGSIPKPITPAPMGEFLWDKFKGGLATTPALLASAGDLVTSGLNVGQELIHKIAPDYVAPANFHRFSGAALENAKGAMAVEDLPEPTDNYGKPSKSNEYLGALANFAGASVLPGVGVVSAAERKLMAALVETGITGLSATSSVEGKEIGRNLAVKYGLDPERGAQIGEFFGSLMGPTLVAGAAKGIEKATAKTGQVITDKTGMTGISKDAQERAGKMMAVKQVREALDSNLSSKANLSEAVDLQQKIPGFNPTLGRASGAPGVVAIEENITRQNPQSLAKAAQREAENTAAVDAYKAEKFPASDVSPTQPAKNLYQAKAADYEKSLDATNKEINNLARRPSEDNAAIGEQLRALRNKAQTAAKGVKDQKYADVYDAANNAGLKAPVDDVQRLMIDVAGSDANAALKMPGVYAALKGAINKYKPQDAGPRIVDTSGKPLGTPPSTTTEVPFEALHSMKKVASGERNAAAAAGDATTARLIGQVEDVITAKLKKFEGPEYGDVAAKLRDANKFYSTKYQPVFNEGLGGRMGPYARTKYGEITQDGDIVRKLVFNPENRRGASEFFDIYGNSPEAHSLLRNGVSDMFTKAVVRDGEIKPALVESFMRQHESQFNLMPALKREFSNIDSLNDALLSRRQSIESQRNMLDKTVVAKIAKNDNPYEVINKALTDRKSMMALVANAANTKGGSDAVASAIARAVAEKDNPYKFLLENESTLRNGLAPLGKQHFDNLVTLAKAQEVSGRVRTPSHVEIDKLNDIGTETVGTPVKGLLSRAYNVNRMGGPSAKYVLADVGGRFIYKIKTEEAMKLMEQAIYDPKMAKALLELEANPSVAKFNEIKNHSFSHGVRITSVEIGKNGQKDDSSKPSEKPAKSKTLSTINGLLIPSPQMPNLTPQNAGARG